MKRMDEKFNSSNALAQNPESVYQMEVDKRIYDITDPEYVQMHCLRFEIERSSGSNSKAK